MPYLFLALAIFLAVKILKRNRQPEYQPQKKRGCISTILKWMLIGFVCIVLLALISPSESTQPSASSSDSIASVKVEEKQPENTPEPTASPSTREEWVDTAAKEVYKDDLISVTWQEVDNQKDMIVIWCDFADNFTNDMRRTYFLGNAKDMFRKVAELGKTERIDYGSCYIVGRTTYLDKYGNEFDGNAMEIRLIANDLEKINWDNISNDMLVSLATTYTVHPLFRD